MVSPVLAFGGVPGGPELVISLVVLVLLFGVPLVIVAGVVVFLKLRPDDEANADRVAELEAEVERLREKEDGEEQERDGGARS